MSLTQQSATELKRELGTGSVSSREIADAYLDRIHACDGEVGAFLWCDPDGTRQAGANSMTSCPGEALGCLAGLPFAVKDVLCTRGCRDDLCLADAGALRPALRRDRDREAEGGRRRLAGQDEHGRVRDGRLDRELGLRDDAQSVGSRSVFRADRAAARRPAWPLRWRRFRSAPTRAARFASRPPSAASSD